MNQGPDSGIDMNGSLFSGADTRHSTGTYSIGQYTGPGYTEQQRRPRPVKQDLGTWMRETQPPGLVWLAGYARSGAALIRTILASCFGQKTASIYPEDYLGDDYTAALNCFHFPISDDEMQAALARQKVLAVKTHEYPARPAEPVRTIVIVRDARRVFGSLKAFYDQRNGLDVSMRQIIEGEHKWTDWSGWVRAWAYATPPDTLWLRYEDVMREPWVAAYRLAEWLDCEIVSLKFPKFAELHVGTPDIFRAAAVDGNGGMTDEEEALFWQRHGGTMRMLGYHE